MPTDTQAGWYQGQSANPLAAATAETDATAACVCACDQHWTCFHKHTPSVKCTLTWISTDLACTVKHRTSSIVPELKVQRLRSVQIFASRPATNLSYMNGSFSTISAAVHVLTSRTFCTRIGSTSRVRHVDLQYTILNCPLHDDPNSLFHDCCSN